MSRIALFALASLMIALSGGEASAGGYHPYYGYTQPCCGYVPPPPRPCCAPAPYYPPYPIYQPYAVPAPTPLPLPPLVEVDGPKYYSGDGYTNTPGQCYRQYVRVPDRYGGWSWGVKSGCDTH